MSIKTISLILAGFSIVMSLVLAYFLQFTDLLAEGMQGNKRTILTVILVAYASYRSYRLYNSIEKNKS